ncbi:DUF5666 domain-containing protein [Thiohalobacter sp. IOR34]|uniref:DUF5666 domain-containing protein n=1 Tax=Thiohalobacter sp. IOR34 TaxID=3057176 RepID=UPI0025B1F71F|nr:DUF5666 domain-containing protein [Thiohalobacter sp. IOR34]WJW74622.1 DUF5666 domain-containing protein [Thiohalobacter sp. IOR34]
MNTRTTILGGTVALAIATGLTACGGGGGGSVAGIGGTGITTTGTITGFGSIIVNGVHYDIDSASISKDGRSATNTAANTDLRVGMVVTVQGTQNDDGTGTATTVIYRDELQGPVSNIDVGASSFEIMGVSVQVDSSTRFSQCSDDGTAPVTLDLSTHLSSNDLVEVSGYRITSGIQATYVELKDSSCTEDDKSEVEVKGTLQTDGSFTTVGGTALTLDTTSAGCVDPVATLGLSGFVELKGSYDPSNGFCTTQGESEDEHPGMDSSSDESYEMEGLITDHDASAQTFRINGVLVYYASASLQVTPGDGTRVEVKGSINSDGSISASSIEADD